MGRRAPADRAERVSSVLFVWCDFGPKKSHQVAAGGCSLSVEAIC